MIIAIDGPAGSGKSTVAKIAAHNLNFLYLDTGAMYRAVAYRALEEGIDLSGGEELIAIATDEPITFVAGGTASISIGGKDVTAFIRTAQVDKAVTPVSACQEVREALVGQQREFGRSHDIVMEGRDIGTVVFPDADLKIFLTANAEERAHRRSEQNIVSGIGDTDEAGILADLIRRDTSDATRQASPLVKAQDAIELDTTDLSIDQVVDRIVELAHEKRGV